MIFLLSYLSLRSFPIHLNSILALVVTRFFTNNLFLINKNLDLLSKSHMIEYVSNMHMVLYLNNRVGDDFSLRWMNFNVGSRILFKTNLEKLLISWLFKYITFGLWFLWFSNWFKYMTSFGSITTGREKSCWESSRILGGRTFICLHKTFSSGHEWRVGINSFNIDFKI